MDTTQKEKRRKHYLETRGRDYALLRIIQGATKAAVHLDMRKEKSRKACRKKVDRRDDD